jgi:hypothetical protein
MVPRGKGADPGTCLWVLAVAFSVRGGGRFGGAQRVYLLVWMAAAWFGIGGDGQVPGGGGGVFPVRPVGHGLGQGLFLLLVQVTQGLVGAGQGLLSAGAVVVAGLAGGVGLSGSAGGAEVGVEDRKWPLTCGAKGTRTPGLLGGTIFFAYSYVARRRRMSHLPAEIVADCRWASPGV